MDQERIDPAVLDERQTAAYLCIKLETLKDLASSGEIPHLLIAGDLRFRVKDLDEYINSKVTTRWGGEQDRTPARRVLKQADLIRESCRVNYLEPAKSRGEETVRIRCGDVAREMGLSQRLPAVVAAIGANKFERLFNVIKVAEEGPGNGANKIFTFKVVREDIPGEMGAVPRPLTDEEQTPWRERMPRTTTEPHSGILENSLTFAQAVTLVAAQPQRGYHTHAGTPFSAEARTTTRGRHEGERVIVFKQGGAEMARAYECCWNHKTNCNRTYIDAYCPCINLL